MSASQRVLALVVAVIGAGCTSSTPMAYRLSNLERPLRIERVGQHVDEGSASGRFSSDQGRIGVLSFNMQHRTSAKQREAVASNLLQDVDPLPDFILLQEVQ